MPARVLYVVNIPRFFVSHRLPLALAARAAGYEVQVATAAADRASIARIEAAGLPFHPLPLSQHGTRPHTELATLAALLGLYRRLRPQVVHQVSIKPVLYGGLAARLAGVPAVVSAMSGLGYVFVDDSRRARLLRGLAQPLLRLALAGPQTRLILQNPDDLERCVSLGLIDRERAVLIRGSGVDLAQFAPQPAPPGLPVVLFAGRLMWQKGPGAFVAAARQLQGRARFVIAGYTEPTSPGAVPADTLAQWQQQGLVELWGQRDDMPQVFAAAHIVCLPSTYGEGVPRVLIEAAACARPIVTTDTPGCREIVRHEYNGLLVPPGDAAALTAALARLIDDAALRQRLGAQGRTLAAAEFSLDQVVQSTLALYAALLPQ
jgi:glycosyltransferase involved in cell wall biosynthesis